MTLVLGSWVADHVILAADSMTHVCMMNMETHAITYGEPLTDRKLFKRRRAGIATYGTGPVNVRVPDVLNQELQADWTVSEVIAFLQRRFSGADEMSALVGGIDDRGDPCLLDVSMSGTEPKRVVPSIGEAAPIVFRGFVNGQLDQTAPRTATSVMAQMLEKLGIHSGFHVGPPYEFLLIPRQ
jgi:hypothetical protein